MVSVHEVAIGVVITCWIVFAIGFIVRKKAPTRTHTKRTGVAAVGFLVEGIAFALVWGVRRDLGSPLFPFGPVIDGAVAVAAAVLAVASVRLTLAAIITLGKHWSPAARVIESHELVTTGPYRVVRHPIYAGMFGLMIATGVTISKPWALLIGIVAYIVGAIMRIHIEEQLMAESFGDRYEAYRRDVPAFIPHIL